MSSSSESSASSDEEEKKQESSDSSSGGSSSSIETAKKKKQAARKRKTVESESEASDDENDEDMEGGREQSSRKRRQPIAGGSSKRVPVSKRTRNMSEGDHIDDEIFEDAEDKKRVMAMSEKEREQEIFNRMEQLETKKAREQIEKKLAAKSAEAETSSAKPMRGRKKKRGSDSDASAPSSPRRKKAWSDSEEEDVDFHRPSEVAKKKKQKDAMATLRQQRLEKEKKNAKKEKTTGSLSLDAVFGKNKDSESDSDSSSSSSSSHSSRSSSSKKSSASSKGSDYEEEKAPAREVEVLQELLPARLSRFKCSKIIHAPFFKQVAVGCFIRIGVGPMGGGQSKYRIMEVAKVVETAKIYQLEDTKTNKGFVLRFGRQERMYRLEFISNSPFSQAEFEEWYQVNKMEGTLPRIDQMENKKKEIEEAMVHRYTDAEIEQIVKEKSRFVQAPRNLAMIKGDLMKKKTVAEQQGDIQKAQELQRQIDELDTKTDRLDKERSKDIKGISWINQRNRNIIRDKLLSGTVKVDINSEDDPFTRKKGVMKVVSGSKHASSSSSSQQLPRQSSDAAT